MQVTSELLNHAQAKLKRAERSLDSHPTDKWLKASVDFLQDEVQTIRQMLLKMDAVESQMEQRWLYGTAAEALEQQKPAPAKAIRIVEPKK
jgi:hypothetical protein